MILDILKDSIEYTTQDYKLIAKLVLLCLFSFFIIPVFLIEGYNYRVIKKSINGVINGRENLPEFNNFKLMFIDGVKVLIVRMIYILIPMILVTFILLSIVVMIEMTIYLLLVVIGFVFFLISNIAVCNMADNNGKFTKAFAFKEITGKIKEIGSAKLLKLLISLSIINLVTYIGLALIIFAIFMQFVSIYAVGPLFWIMMMIFLVFSSFSEAILGNLHPFLISIVEYLIITAITVPFLSIINARSIGLSFTWH